MKLLVPAFLSEIVPPASAPKATATSAPKSQRPQRQHQPYTDPSKRQGHEV